MLVKELRAARWAVLAALLIVASRVLDVATTNLRAQTVRTLTQNIDADFAPVSTGHVSAGTAYVWASFFTDVNLYLLVGLGGAIFGAALIASEVSSGSIFILLSRPLSRQRILLTKYGVAAGLLLLLCGLCGGLALLLGRWQGVELSVGGVLLSILLLWLAVLFVLSLTLLYSVLVPSALAAGFLGFFTTYLLVIVPLFHDARTHQYALGGPDWSIGSYWGTLGIYAGVESPAKSLVVALVAALIPLLVAVFLFMRKAF
jgi:ABC-type transport system involved in multi-copper enzyme maturation permease subunit